MKLDLTKIANEPVGWILHGTINPRNKSDARERISQITAGELIVKHYLGRENKK